MRVSTSVDSGATRLGLVAVLMLVMIALSATPTAANPYIAPDFRNAQEGIASTFLMNLPIDIFLVSLALFPGCIRYEEKVGSISSGTRSFVLRILVASVIVAGVGAFIDFYTIYQKLGNGYISARPDNALVAIATLLILASVYIAYVFVIKVNWKHSLIPSIGVALASPITWFFTSSADEEAFLIVTLIVFSILTLLPLALLANWHKGSFLARIPQARISAV